MLKNINERNNSHRVSRSDRVLVSDMHMMREVWQVWIVTGVVPSFTQVLLIRVHPLVTIFNSLYLAQIDHEEFGYLHEVIVSQS